MKPLNISVDIKEMWPTGPTVRKLQDFFSDSMDFLENFMGLYVDFRTFDRSFIYQKTMTRLESEYYKVPVYEVHIGELPEDCPQNRALIRVPIIHRGDCHGLKIFEKYEPLGMYFGNPDRIYVIVDSMHFVSIFDPEDMVFVHDRNATFRVIRKLSVIAEMVRNLPSINDEFWITDCKFIWNPQTFF